MFNTVIINLESQFKSLWYASRRIYSTYYPSFKMKYFWSSGLNHLSTMLAILTHAFYPFYPYLIVRGSLNWLVRGAKTVLSYEHLKGLLWCYYKKGPKLSKTSSGLSFRPRQTWSVSVIKLLHKGHFNQIEVIKRTSWPPTQKCYNNYTLLSNRQLTAKLARVNFYSHLWYFNSQNWCFFALCSDLFNCHYHKRPLQTIA